MNVFAVVYILYFLISVAIIHLTARILSRSSTTFLLETFHGDAGRALLVDRVIIASFFLANVGFVVSNAPYTSLDAVTRVRAVAVLLEKLGAALLFTGFTLFLGLWIFTRVRRLHEPASTR